jgi:flagellin
MRISHSITALITSASHSMEQLSGGSCVKSEADSAAGLSISEKMRSQIKGLTQGAETRRMYFVHPSEGAL